MDGQVANAKEDGHADEHLGGLATRNQLCLHLRAGRIGGRVAAAARNRAANVDRVTGTQRVLGRAGARQSERVRFDDGRIGVVVGRGRCDCGFLLRLRDLKCAVLGHELWSVDGR